MLTLLRVTRPLRFTSPGRLLPWPGPALRGLLARPFKASVCRQTPAEQETVWRYCRGCPHMAGCPYGQTLEPDPPPGAPVFPGQEQAVRPLVLAPPYPAPARVGPGDGFPLTVTFIGEAAIGHAGRVWEALAVAGADPRGGLDPDRTTFHLGPSSEVEGPGPVRLPLAPDDGPGLVSKVRVRLTGPLFLRERGPDGRRGHLRVPAFADLLRAALRTLGGLFAVYNRPLPAAFARLKEAAGAVPLRESHFADFYQHHWSNRQEQGRPLHGVVGAGVYGPVLAVLLPWLAWGGRVHVGTDRVAGAGGWEVEAPDPTVPRVVAETTFLVAKEGRWLWSGRARRILHPGRRPRLFPEEAGARGHSMLTDEQRHRLVNAARAAVARAFLSTPGGTAYGAAALTVNGGVYPAGQYSSFNHVTNVHAEQAALLLATMADDPDVLALAVASTGSDPVTRPCGVCRQVLAEHAARTGRDFEVLMACRQGPGHEWAPVSQLLPWGWTPSSALPPGGHPESRFRTGPLRPAAPPEERLPRVGDQVELTGGCVALVWDDAFGEALLTKVKYAPAAGQGLRKLRHSLTEPLAYHRELHELGWDRPTGTGAKAAVVRPGEVRGVLPALAPGNLPDPVPGPLGDLLSRAGIAEGSLRVGGSRALGLQSVQSDWDLVVPVSPDALLRVRAALREALHRGELALPPASGTWRLLDRLFPGGRQAVVGQGRFLDTIEVAGASAALLFVQPDGQAPALAPGWEPAGRGLLHGRVSCARNAGYKRAEYAVATDEFGTVAVTCYHKVANLLREGDVLSLRGWLLRRGQEWRLMQFLPVPDGIVWLGAAGN
jgi:cytidine deaminase